MLRRLKPRKFMLKFTPLEFETFLVFSKFCRCCMLKFTPLEFETNFSHIKLLFVILLKFTPLEFETYENNQDH